MTGMHVENPILGFLLDSSGRSYALAEHFLPFFPSLILLAGVMVILLFPKDLKFTGFMAYFSVILALFFAFILDSSVEQTYFWGMVQWTHRAFVAQVILLIFLFLTLLASTPFLQESKHTTEYYALIIFASVGGVQMTMASHFISLFLGIELLALPTYLLCSFRKDNSRSREAGFKYFVLGAFAAGLLLMGAAYFYGATGSLYFTALIGQKGGYFVLGGCFLLAALAFKAALFPFHTWLPDVYEGAPAPVTGFMASAVKIVVFAMLLTLTYQFALYSSELWVSILKFLVILSMTLANLAALRQRSVKRMLAYSSISHVAYAFIALIATSGAAGYDAAIAVLFYIAIYGFASLGSFAVIAYLDPVEDKPLYFENLNGLAKVQPFVALAFSAFLLSLAGIPPVAGFVGKFYLFSSAIASGHIDLAIVGIINSLISVYYYARPVVCMYMNDLQAPDRPLAVTTFAVIFVAFVLTLAFGIFPSILYNFVAGL